MGWVPARRSATSAPRVIVERRSGPVALFAALAGMDLGADAASTFDPARGSDPELTEAYLAAPGRLAVQALGLVHLDRAGLEAALRHPPRELGDPAGRRLCALLLERLPVDPPGNRRAEVVGSWLPARLEPLRSRLWAERGAAPPLRVLDVPALGRHGRGTVVDGEHRVAVSLDQDDEHLLMQILHEEVHPVTDPFVLAELPGARDTRRGEAGYEVHAALEATAVAATEALLGVQAPSLLPAFQRWLRGSGSAEASPG
jgi:hypothetical protein